MADPEEPKPSFSQQVISLTAESSLAGGTHGPWMYALQQHRHSWSGDSFTAADSLGDLFITPIHTEGTPVQRRYVLQNSVDSRSGDSFTAADLSTAGQVGKGLWNDCVFLGHQSYGFAWEKISCYRYDTSKHVRACISYDGIHVFSFDYDPNIGSIQSRGDPVLIDFIQDAVDRNVRPNSFYLWMLGAKSHMLREAFSLDRF